MQYTRVISVVITASLVAHLASPAGVSPLPRSESSFDAVTMIPDGWTAYLCTALVVALGAWIGSRLRLPAGSLLGLLILGVALQGLGVLSIAWPPGVPEASYAILGVYVGLLFDRTSVGRAGRLLPLVLATTGALIIACAGLALAFAAFTNVDFLTAYLATTPGGIDAVAIVAVGSGADASLVLAVQVLRLLAVVLVGQLIARGTHLE